MSTIEKITGTLHSLKGPKRRFPGFSAWMTGNGAPPESAQIRTSRLRALHLGTINGVGGFALNRNFSPDREYFVSFRDEGSSKFVDIIMPDKTLSVCLKENGQYFRSGKKELLAPKPLTPNQQEHGIQITALLTRVRAGDQQAAIKLLAGFEMLIEKLAAGFLAVGGRHDHKRRQVFGE